MAGCARLRPFVPHPGGTIHLRLKKKFATDKLRTISAPVKSKNAHHSDGPTKLVGITPRALKLKDACQYIGGVSDITMRRLIDRGLIKPNRSLRVLLIPVAELDRFINP